MPITIGLLQTDQGKRQVFHRSGEEYGAKTRLLWFRSNVQFQYAMTEVLMDGQYHKIVRPMFQTVMKEHVQTTSIAKISVVDAFKIFLFSRRWTYTVYKCIWLSTSKPLGSDGLAPGLRNSKEVFTITFIKVSNIKVWRYKCLFS